MPSIMIAGTTSSAGKSVVVAALCRILSKMGYEVAPFKAQNMSLNSYITRDGHEIAYAQAFQALAAGKEPDVRMNPVLLKPKGNLRSQLVVMGRPVKDVSTLEYYREVPGLLRVVEEAYRTLEEENDFVVIEGAGGMAEINLYDRDMANIGIARIARPDVYIVTDIDRGGSFASLYGTYSLLPEDVRSLVSGFIVNRFRGYEPLLYPGFEKLEKLTGVRVVGVIPYFEGDLPSEDSLSIEDWERGGEVGVIRLPRISNFTDFEPIRGLVEFVDLKGSVDDYELLILPGTKETVRDLAELKRWGMDEKIRRFARDRPVVGICGGFQMLGKAIVDHGVEAGNVRVKGIGLIDADTEFRRYEKVTRQVTKRVTEEVSVIERLRGEEVSGYEIHMGLTRARWPVFEDDGGKSEDGLVWGTYLHGLLFNENVAREFYRYVGRRFEGLDDLVDRFARVVEEKLDVEHIIDRALSSRSL
ncbi:adenosylcobyric acid synthase {glutamine-hydrolysing} [Geoglobus ahangari]|uniref:Probable cobyric acid synthase n=1 Tax=Geoglobus ahangari TaxID=113653 RepID=A0A0F7DB92_9EURY|nr:cobyric acid synthase CobQ [Geoglobus ahangari]AKG90686.1 adenosylcobyric acid synthase {glutamine-hydrolysing} [Geoglobus ahangari]